MHDDAIARIGAALERIAVALERFELLPPQPCTHPVGDRELLPRSTMTKLAYLCKACGAEI